MADLSFSDYPSLIAAVQGWLARDDAMTLAAIPAMIKLAESAISRKLRNSTLRATITIAGESTQIPADVAELRSIRLVSGTPSWDYPMMIGTPEMLDDYRARSSDTASRPRIAAIVGTQILVAPPPDVAYDADITYFEKLVPLSVSNPTNSVLADSPDVYLYGTLAAAETFLEHDDRVQLWGALFTSSLDDIFTARQSREYGASLAPARLPVVF